MTTANIGLAKSWAAEFGPSAVEYESAVVIWPGTYFAWSGQASN